MDDKFCHDAFTKVGFSQWRNIYTTFPKHVGGPNSIHNTVATTFHDFCNKKLLVIRFQIIVKMLWLNMRPIWKLP